MVEFARARQYVDEFKGDSYVYGLGALAAVGSLVAPLGTRIALVRSSFRGSDGFVWTLRRALARVGVAVIGEIRGPAPNAPREDLVRITRQLDALDPDVVVSFGGGSCIDATKAALVLHSLGGDIDSYFGTGLVSGALERQNVSLVPHVAIQSASSSAAHLTKYANITNLQTGQKKLIVDDAIVPRAAVFDYAATFTAPATLTADGAMDGFSHALEVLYGAVRRPDYERIEAISLECIRLVVNYLPSALAEPTDSVAREAVGLATDLGGYAIMLGGTNG
ncbi:MAG TPA: iron-containing alcohol dehydrogenase, partial [Chloroflexi bacterium]|nr:iron-containing alcohol dehydrogenase [Chloroflexota bacterium]